MQLQASPWLSPAALGAAGSDAAWGCASWQSRPLTAASARPDLSRHAHRRLPAPRLQAFRSLATARMTAAEDAELPIPAPPSPPSPPPLLSDSTPPAGTVVTQPLRGPPRVTLKPAKSGSSVETPPWTLASLSSLAFTPGSILILCYLISLLGVLARELGHR